MNPSPPTTNPPPPDGNNQPPNNDQMASIYPPMPQQPSSPPQNSGSMPQQPGLSPAPSPSGPIAASQMPPNTQQPTSMPSAEQPKPTTNAGNIVLQWLTYAFWGWTVFIMSFLTFFVLESMIAEGDSNSFIIYLVAAILVLLPISLVTDTLYSKQEPEHKTGAASIVMVIHAVIFALFAIGALIAMVFSLVTLFTSSSETTTNQIALYSAGIIFVLYAITFLRTLNPLKFSWIGRAYMIFMVATVGIIAVFGIIGPVAQERSTRGDKLINSGLPSLSDAINDYAADNSSLPDSLSQLDLKNDDAKKLVSDKLVEYKPNTKPASSSLDNDYYSDSFSSTPSSSRKTFYYQLCVDYKEADENDFYSGSSLNRDDEYRSYISTYGHDSGETCYKVSTRAY